VLANAIPAFWATAQPPAVFAVFACIPSMIERNVSSTIQESACAAVTLAQAGALVSITWTGLNAPRLVIHESFYINFRKIVMNFLHSETFIFWCVFMADQRIGIGHFDADAR
jgi:hypothetical protein